MAFGLDTCPLVELALEIVHARKIGGERRIPVRLTGLKNSIRHAKLAGGLKRENCPDAAGIVFVLSKEHDGSRTAPEQFVRRGEPFFQGAPRFFFELD
jgi:hypothetical protein